MEQQPVKERREKAISFSAKPLFPSLVINSFPSQSTNKGLILAVKDVLGLTHVSLSKTL